MVFTNSWQTFTAAMKFVGIGCSVLLFSACANFNPLGDKAGVEETEVLEPVESDVDAVVERVITPNPYFEQLVTVDEQTKVRFELAVEDLKNGDLDLAEKGFNELNRENPGLSGPLVNLGIVHYQRDDANEAEAYWLAAIEANDLNFDAYNYLGLSYREKGEFLAAESIYQAALAKWDDNAEIHCNLGILYDLYMGRAQPALDEYKLCELLIEEPSRQLRGWIVDLERRLPSVVTE